MVRGNERARSAAGSTSLAEENGAGARRVLVTGGGGYIGRLLIEDLARDPRSVERIVACDVRLPPPAAQHEGVEYLELDVRSRDLATALHLRAVDTVVHLAAIVTPTPQMTPEFLYDVEVQGTRNVLDACLAAGVSRFVYTSSGAAYGYWPDNAEWIDEDAPIRGNDAFAYSRHKRLVEEMLARYRADHPELSQLVLRVGTILGETVANQITAMFERPVVLGVAGSPSPFVFVWDRDVVGALRRGIDEGQGGVFNLAGDGTLAMPEIAARLGKRYVEVPAWLLQAALAILHPLGISPYGPEQVDFLRYRPVLSNRRLKEEFGYVPRKTSAEVFDLYLDARRARR